MDCKIDQSKYGVPMPWIGLYVTAASVACSIAMLGDFIWGIRSRRLWFPCKFFSLNATSLTLIAIATKLPVDLNNPMPTAREQLAKLSGTAFLCITMANFTTSLGNMKDSDVILNVIPLVILVITVVVNVSIQMGTGVIHAFLPEHVVTIFFLLILLMLTCNAAFAVTVFKPFVGGVYRKIHRSLSRILKSDADFKKCGESEADQRLKYNAYFKKHVKRYWTAVLCLDPQYNLYRSERGLATDILSVLETGVLIQALIRTLKQGSVIHNCTSEQASSSDYRWSIEGILFVQVVAVGVGVLGPLYRILQTDHVNFDRIRSSEESDERSDGHTVNGPLNEQEFDTLQKPHENAPSRSSVPTLLATEGLNDGIRAGEQLMSDRLPTLMESDLDPLSIDMIQSRSWRRLLHCSENVIRWILAYNIWAGSALTFLLSQLRWVLWLASCPLSLKPARLILFPFTKDSLVTELKNSFGEGELKKFLEYAESRSLKITDGLLLFRLVNANKWIQDESKKSAEFLTKLVKVSSASRRTYPRTDPLVLLPDPPEFRLDQLVHKSSGKVCWALRVVNLTSIAVLMPCEETAPRTKSELLRGVGEGLKYLRFLDKYSKRPVNVRKAANAVWEYVDLYHRWFDADVDTFNLRNDPMDIIEGLEGMGKKYKESEELSNQLGKMEKSPKAVAYKSMSAICRAIRDKRGDNSFANADEAYTWLCSRICNVLAAGLMDLRRYLHRYYRNAFERKEEHVEEVAYLLCMAENILEDLEKECDRDCELVKELQFYEENFQGFS